MPSYSGKGRGAASGVDDHVIPHVWSVSCFYSRGLGGCRVRPAGAGEALLCALSGQAELGSDDGPGCSGLAGSGDGGGQGGLGGVGLLVGGGDPAQDVERRTGW